MPRIKNHKYEFPNPLKKPRVARHFRSLSREIDTNLKCTHVRSRRSRCSNGRSVVDLVKKEIFLLKYEEILNMNLNKQ